MKPHLLAVLVLSCAMGVSVTGCAVSRDQSTVGEYVDDATVTARVKARFAEDKVVSALSIGVETLRGSVQLSGFARSTEEKARAESLARATPGAKSVINDIAVRP